MGPGKRLLGTTLGWLAQSSPRADLIDLLAERPEAKNRLVRGSFSPMAAGLRCTTCRTVEFQY
ncbi:MAG: hypothetical protein KGJ23_10035 [Euryarchaeota archaeon]|nr:hypothetical protein [Euryarchaeota archaeon]MDE1836943.1 hypothetical protein [Euryarchaeota archaeon]MDE1881904.1 hypothetical protein [Euryarchaeota archaeon]MDE2045872.1 hypothetical protein [Thermoplasmata archaeon]